MKDGEVIWTGRDEDTGREIDVYACDDTVVLRAFRLDAITSRYQVEISAEDALDLMLALGGWLHHTRTTTNGADAGRTTP